MKHSYLALAIAGTVLPYYFFLQLISAPDPDRVGFMMLAFANPVAAGFTVDLFISSFVFWIVMFSAGPNSPKPWPFVLINLFIGLSAALPAWLYWRARQSDAATGIDQRLPG